MKLNEIAPNHIEVLVSVKTITIKGVKIPVFTPIDFCKN
jgi:hypothetical protein